MSRPGFLRILFTRHRAKLAVAALPLVLAACSGSVDPAPGEINDPYAPLNRRLHEGLKRTDRAVLRPASVGYAQTVPRGVQDSISNFRTNFATPAYVVNDMLQMQGEDALVNAYRFLVNTTFGLGGLFDPAAQLGLPARKSDFGGTLHFWRVPEGAYLSVPIIGPSTERDLAGRIADGFLNPLAYAVPTPERYVVTGAGVLDRLGKRGRYAGTVDSLLYDSADSYAQTRNTYLQNRRYELSGTGAALDPYADTTGANATDADPYTDPYLDPYAE